MTTIDERRGTIFAGRYRLERKLGSGGMADVWLAEDQELGRKVAIKMLHERYANDTQFVERFRREATHAAGLSHPNVVSIYDRGEAEGSYFIVMEYVEGGPSRSSSRAGPAPCPSRSRTSARCSPRSATRTGTGSSTATSSRTTCSSTTRAGSRSPTSGSPGRLEPDHRGGLDHRHGAVPLAGAGARRARRRVVRPLLDRDRPLRAAHRATSRSPARRPSRSR